MEENGYRPPQFSEDTAWVPVWLQSCRVSSLSQQARRADSFPQSTNNVEWPPETLGDGQEPIREGAANNNIELFLSGDDICSVGNSLSKESVQPFQLHLSSDVSEHSLNQYYESCGASLSSRGTVHPKFTPDCLVVKNLEGPCEKLRNTVPMANSEAQVTNMQKYHICPEPDNNNSERRNFSIGFLENADADSAIELSIVASEALSISDMVCSSLPSEACATSAVLEIALKVKEARIQACVSNADVSLISSEEVEEVDALSDLDEEAMVDAFSDVGLSPIKGIVKNNSCCMQLNGAVNLKVGACEHYTLLTKKMGENVDNYQITAAKSQTCLAEECILYPSSVATHVAGSCSVYVANERHLEVQAADPVGTFSERNSTHTASARQHELLVITTSEVAKSITEHFKGSEELDFNTKSWGPIQFKECTAFGVETGETHSEKSMSIQPFKSRWLGGWTGREVDLDAESLEPFESETSIVTPSWVQDPGDHTAEVTKKAGSKGYSGSHQHDSCVDQVRTTKLLYGCATNARLLTVDWLIDSISLGSMLPPDKYLLLPNQSAGMQNMGLRQSAYIFDGVGIMLYGKASFCIKFTKLIRHGGGRVFKTLQWLVQNLRNKKVNIGAIVVEDMGWATRHLKQCASEYKLNMMSANWITGSLLSRKVLPFDTNDMDLFSTIKEAGVEVIGSSQEM